MAAFDQNYTLGRGEVHFGLFAPGTQISIGERYMGNTPALTISLEPEELPHYSSDRGIREKDDSVTLQLNRTGSLTTDSINPDNMAILLLGETSTQTQAATPVVGESIATHATIGLWYQLGTSDANPSGVREVSSVVIKDGATTLVAGTDYLLDPDLARFQTLTAAAAAKTLSVDYTPAAKSRIRVISKGNTIEGSLRFIAYNPKGKNFDYFMPWVKLAPSGEFALKGEEWQSIPFQLEILKKTGQEAIYMDGRPFAAA